jgi:hypothetical protein
VVDIAGRHTTLLRALRISECVLRGRPVRHRGSYSFWVAWAPAKFQRTRVWVVEPITKRTMLREIRVSTKEELIDRIHLYFREVNATPVIFRWKYKMDEVRWLVNQRTMI